MSENRLINFPVSFFSVILGLAGFAIAFLKAETILSLPFAVGGWLLGFALIIFVILAVLYGLKFIKHRKEVQDEFHHPIKLNFFPTVSISLLLFAIAFLEIDMRISEYLWYVGTILHLYMTLKILTRWIHHDKFEMNHFNPAWFIPAVGNILVPIAGVTHGYVQISWFFYSIGIILWIVLFTIFWNRIIFHKPLPQKLLPTMFILIAPPAIGFIALVKLTGGINEFASVLYYFAAFLFLLLAYQYKMFAKIKFFLSWWAYSFPISAMTIATLLMYHSTELIFFKIFSYLLLSILALMIPVLIVLTIMEIRKKEICVVED